MPGDAFRCSTPSPGFKLFPLHLSFIYLGSDLMEIKDIPIKNLEKRTVSSQKSLYLSTDSRLEFLY